MGHGASGSSGRQAGDRARPQRLRHFPRKGVRGFLQSVLGKDGRALTSRRRQDSYKVC
jgi:hypothetical protein